MGSPNTFDLAAEAVLRIAGAAGADVDEAITETLEALARSSNADRSYVTRFNSDGTFGNSHEWTAPDIVPHRPAIQNLPMDSFRYSYELGAKGQVLYARRLDDLPPEADEERRSFGSFGVQSVLQVPILVDGQLLGVIGFNHMRSEGNWGDDTIERVQLVGRAIGVALSRRAAHEQLVNALLVAEQANHAMDDLVSRASHELRTPLHAVLGFAEILELDGIRHEALDQIRDNGRHLLGMIDELLDLGQLASTGHDDEEGPLRDLLQDVMNNLEQVATHRGVTLVVNAAQGAQPINWPEGRTRQVLHCIASTAIVSAGVGGTVTATAMCAQPSSVEFEYSGPQRGEPMGLGLALARSFTESMKGTLEITSNDHSTRIVVRHGSHH